MAYCTSHSHPTQIVLLGATGDLAQKKLLPSLMNLFAKGSLPQKIHIIAFSRDTLSSDAYRAFAENYVQGKSATPHAKEIVTDFLSHFEYVQGTFDDRASFERIKNALNAYDEQIGMCTSKLFYLAVPPVFYDTIFEQIAHTKLDLPCAEGDGWIRVLVEKPFGRDLIHAHTLEDKLSVLFTEEQIYRIDHYLAKDALQNILAFRFSNVLFAKAWHKEFVEAVSIKVFERFDVSTRGAFFDGVGALRDVGQNHMLQMLALIALDPPPLLNTTSLRAHRAALLRTLRKPTKDALEHSIVKGQYADYHAVPNVEPESKTETYFALKTYLDHPNWEGVPFYLEHGKGMRESVSEITIRFRSSKHCVCGDTNRHAHPNFVRFLISPHQKIIVRFWVRKPGTQFELIPNDLVFDHDAVMQQEGIVTADAYEEVLNHAICGDQTLFVSNAEQEAAWSYVTSILEMWQDTTPLPYERGSDGPPSAIKEEIQKLFTV